MYGICLTRRRKFWLTVLWGKLIIFYKICLGTRTVPSCSAENFNKRKCLRNTKNCVHIDRVETGGALMCTVENFL